VKAHCDAMYVMGLTFAFSQNGLFSVLYHSMSRVVRGIHPAASGGTEKINVLPGTCFPSDVPKVKLPHQRIRNRLHATALKEYSCRWVLGSFERLFQAYFFLLISTGKSTSLLEASSSVAKLRE